MMLDIAYIVIACTFANHLGLVSAIEAIIHRAIPIVNCPKCFTFWSTLVYGIIGCMSLLQCIAISFIAALSAVWLDIMLMIVDYYYIKIYETFNNNGSETDPSSSSDADASIAGTSDSLPELRQEERED